MHLQLCVPSFVHYVLLLESICVWRAAEQQHGKDRATWSRSQDSVAGAAASSAVEQRAAPSEVDQPSLGAGSACVDYFKQPWNHIVRKNQKGNQWCISAHCSLKLHVVFHSRFHQETTPPSQQLPMLSLIYLHPTSLRDVVSCQNCDHHCRSWRQCSHTFSHLLPGLRRLREGVLECQGWAELQAILALRNWDFFVLTAGKG